MTPQTKAAQTMTIVHWLKTLAQRLTAHRDPATAGPKANRRKPPAAFCTHIATTMHWRISGGD